jgi:hypothetical protein
VSAKQPRIPGTCSQRTLYLLPEIRDGDSSARKNGLAIRNACAVEGRCPYCYAVGEIHPDGALEGVYHYVFRHENWCRVLLDGDAA